ncbi:hypothetical protein BLNAU_2650 [Blattamonas nauphoetae]|uniref:Far11/STRP C-terminal domain-containing protein n=1 Tax=Blattamonas nauphoetae TaxID=2049346 RepID=A0ABQ9YF65_9EUKA|nr:hypothetical protein BLNAU_2650 [Blattamonas nauphoetae]
MDGCDIRRSFTSLVNGTFSVASESQHSFTMMQNVHSSLTTFLFYLLTFHTAPYVNTAPNPTNETQAHSQQGTSSISSKDSDYQQNSNPLFQSTIPRSSVSKSHPTRSQLAHAAADLKVQIPFKQFYHFTHITHPFSVDALQFFPLRRVQILLSKAIAYSFSPQREKTLEQSNLNFELYSAFNNAPVDLPPSSRPTQQKGPISERSSTPSLPPLQRTPSNSNFGFNLSFDIVDCIEFIRTTPTAIASGPASKPGQHYSITHPPPNVLTHLNAVPHRHGIDLIHKKIAEGSISSLGMRQSIQTPRTNGTNGNPFQEAFNATSFFTPSKQKTSSSPIFIPNPTLSRLNSHVSLPILSNPTILSSAPPLDSSTSQVVVHSLLLQTQQMDVKDAGIAANQGEEEAINAIEDESDSDDNHDVLLSKGKQVSGWEWIKDALLPISSTKRECNPVRVFNPFIHRRQSLFESTNLSSSGKISTRPTTSSEIFINYINNPTILPDHSTLLSASLEHQKERLRKKKAGLLQSTKEEYHTTLSLDTLSRTSHIRETEVNMFVPKSQPAFLHPYISSVFHLIPQLASLRLLSQRPPHLPTSITETLYLLSSHLSRLSSPALSLFSTFTFRHSILDDRPNTEERLRRRRKKKEDSQGDKMLQDPNSSRHSTPTTSQPSIRLLFEDERVEDGIVVHLSSYSTPHIVQDTPTSVPYPHPSQEVPQGLDDDICPSVKSEPSDIVSSNEAVYQPFSHTPRKVRSQDGNVWYVGDGMCIPVDSQTQFIPPDRSDNQPVHNPSLHPQPPLVPANYLHPSLFSPLDYHHRPKAQTPHSNKTYHRAHLRLLETKKQAKPELFLPFQPISTPNSEMANAAEKIVTSEPTLLSSSTFKAIPHNSRPSTQALPIPTPTMPKTIPRVALPPDVTTPFEHFYSTALHIIPDGLFSLIKHTLATTTATIKIIESENDIEKEGGRIFEILHPSFAPETNFSADFEKSYKKRFDSQDPNLTTVPIETKGLAPLSFPKDSEHHPFCVCSSSYQEIKENETPQSAPSPLSQRSSRTKSVSPPPKQSSRAGTPTLTTQEKHVATSLQILLAQASLKALSVVLLYLLKFARRSNQLQFQHLTQMLSDRSCILLILRFTQLDHSRLLHFNSFDRSAMASCFPNSLCSRFALAPSKQDLSFPLLDTFVHSINLKMADHRFFLRTHFWRAYYFENGRDADAQRTDRVFEWTRSSPSQSLKKKMFTVAIEDDISEIERHFSFPSPNLDNKPETNLSILTSTARSTTKTQSSPSAAFVLTRRPYRALNWNAAFTLLTFLRILQKTIKSFPPRIRWVNFYQGEQALTQLLVHFSFPQLRMIVARIIKELAQHSFASSIQQLLTNDSIQKLNLIYFSLPLLLGENWKKPCPPDSDDEKKRQEKQGMEMRVILNLFLMEQYEFPYVDSEDDSVVQTGSFRDTSAADSSDPRPTRLDPDPDQDDADLYSNASYPAAIIPISSNVASIKNTLQYLGLSPHQINSTIKNDIATLKIHEDPAFEAAMNSIHNQREGLLEI